MTTSATDWRRAYLDNPLLRCVASLLVWQQDHATFTVGPNGTVTADSTAYCLTDHPITPAHPMEMSASELEGWQNYFLIKGLKQPFEQVWEPVVEGERVAPDRFAGYMIPYFRFLGREKHGIGVEDEDFHNDIRISFKGCTATVERIDWERHEIDMNHRFEVKDFRFQAYNRLTNHIVTYLDKCTVYDRILKDDASVAPLLSRFTLVQILEFINIATENKCTNVLAVLMEYKNVHFAEYDPLEAFTLDL